MDDQVDALLRDIEERAIVTIARRQPIARKAGVRRVEPFHFSPRYTGQEERMLNEVIAAFTADVRKERTREGLEPSSVPTPDLQERVSC